MDPDERADLSDAERVRLERRDRRRRSRMVVDNAGVKRVVQALAKRRQRSADTGEKGQDRDRR